nr:MAG TPA: distal tail protein [Caudoviricetes sp.]
MIYWAGKSSDDVKVVVEKYPQKTIPQRKVSAITVPGRNGDLLQDEGAYSNYTQQYDVYLSAERQKLPKIAHAAAEWLCRPSGYNRLEDDYDHDVFKMAYFSGPVDIENIFNRFGRATLNFVCKPQSFLKSGFFPLSFLSPGTIHNITVFPALPLITLYGSGPASLQIGAYSVAISSIDEYLTLDCDTQNAYKDTQNKNATISADEFPTLKAGDNSIGWNGQITRIEIVPRWWTL